MNRVTIILFYVLGLSLLYTSCTREDDLVTAIEEYKYDPSDANGTYSEAHWRRVHAAQRQAYIGDLYRSYGVGYGYNGTGKYSDYDEVRDRVINLSYIQQFDEEHGSSTIVDDVSPSSYHHVYSGTDAMTICQKLTANASVKVDVLLFQGEAKTTFNKTDMTSNEYSFCTIHDGLTVASRHLEPYDLYYIARQHPEALSPGFLRYQELASKALKKNNQTEAIRILQNMLQTYGTHIIYHAQLGGKLKFSTTINRHVVDSRNSLDEQAGLSFLHCIGTKKGTQKDNWVVNTSEQRETHIECLGGNSAIALDFIALQESNDMTARSQKIDEWFKSLKFDPSLPKDSNNVELIEIKVAPISDLLFDEKVVDLYKTMVGEQVKYETEVMPRARNQVYAQVPFSALKTSNRTGNTQVVVDHEIIGEVLNEYVHNVEYTVFYPTLGGKVCHEGLGRRCSDDSLFTITWQYLDGKESEAKAYVTPLLRLNYDDYVYYNNGEIDIAPADNATNYKAVDSISPGAIYMWNDTCLSCMKIGPYFLHQGVLANTSSNVSAMNSVYTLLQDVPVGYEVADTTTINEIIHFMYYSGEVFADDRIEWNSVPPFFTNKQFIMRDNHSNRYGIFSLEPKKSAVTSWPNETMGQALLRRKDFMFK
ncbi:MAG: hypothetical protein J6O54_03825 [Prevotella sp.]|nr:hypothetical protein [Prevotella sp.]